ncbi:MAG TPA: UDP-N-acetylenolpyruvoylglucosamine reductase [Rhodospirillaceae bacterium]|nr:UDP-N-acetylenolpyruvoylglucosamine reductase [Rhodospirillaceae bacterium]
MNDTAPTFSDDLLKKLPPVRGKITANAPLSAGSWLQVGGSAEVLFKPHDEQDLADFLKGSPKDVELTVLGSCSNVLVRDGGIPGIVIRLGPRFSACYCEEDMIVAGSGSIDSNVARVAHDAGFTKFEFLCSIPGTIGGGLHMNAGAYGREIKDILIDVRAVTRDGEIITIKAEDMGLGYRSSNVPAGVIFLSARFKGPKDNPEAIGARMKEILEERSETQPSHVQTGGSTFANPEGHSAWKLIEEAGCRGLRIGNAVMSEKHCNFMINESNATATDLEALGEEVRRRVKEKSGIELKWEIKRIGVPLKEETTS